VCVRATEVLYAPGFLFLFIRRSIVFSREGVGPIVSAQVGEWLKPTDCKSVPPSEVRRFESFPVHQE
jgi:hypothetical protein